MKQISWRTLQRVKGWLGLERFHALNMLDKKLLQWLDYRDGFFIECGANDGVTQSNTLFFERYRGWRGLLVEPVPELAAKCRKNRPDAIVEQCALVADCDRGKSINFTYCDLMTTADGALGGAENVQEHISVGAKVQSIEPYRFEAIGCPLSDLLERHHVDHVDLFSLDVEGAESAVLDGLDLKRHAPKLILVETRSQPEVDSRLLPRYELVGKLSVHDLLYRLRS